MAGRCIRRIVLETDAVDNYAACSFYEREGYSVRRTYSTHEGRKMHEYRKDL